MNEDWEWVTCSCCGRGIRNTKEENAHYEQVPYPDDEGFGLCLPCVDWSWNCYADARIPVLRKNLSAENQAKLDSMPLGKQRAIVMKLAEKGAFSW